jgi:hypothetical protein
MESRGLVPPSAGRFTIQDGCILAIRPSTDRSVLTPPLTIAPVSRGRRKADGEYIRRVVRRSVYWEVAPPGCFQDVRAVVHSQLSRRYVADLARWCAGDGESGECGEQCTVAAAGNPAWHKDAACKEAPGEVSWFGARPIVPAGETGLTEVPRPNPLPRMGDGPGPGKRGGKRIAGVCTRVQSGTRPGTPPSLTTALIMFCDLW